MEETLVLIENEEIEHIISEPYIEQITPTTQEKIITPSQNQQIVKPDDGVFALSKVTVEAIPSDYVKPSGILEIDSNGEYDVKEFEKTKVQLPSDVDKYFNTNITSRNADNCWGLMYGIKEVPNLTIKDGTLARCFAGFGGTKIGKITCSTTNLERFCMNAMSLENIDVSGITGDITTFLYAWYYNSKLKSLDISHIDCSNTTNISNVFFYNNALSEFSGFKNLGKGYTQKATNYSSYKLDLSTSTALTHDSLMNVINNLYDLNLTYDVENGGTLYSQSLVLGNKNLAKLTEEEIAIATNKGWAVS